MLSNLPSTFERSESRSNGAASPWSTLLDLLLFWWVTRRKKKEEKILFTEHTLVCISNANQNGTNGTLLGPFATMLYCRVVKRSYHNSLKWTVKILSVFFCSSPSLSGLWFKSFDKITGQVTQNDRHTYLPHTCRIYGVRRAGFIVRAWSNISN